MQWTSEPTSAIPNGRPDSGLFSRLPSRFRHIYARASIYISVFYHLRSIYAQLYLYRSSHEYALYFLFIHLLLLCGSSLLLRLLLGLVLVLAFSFLLHILVFIFVLSYFSVFVCHLSVYGYVSCFSAAGRGQGGVSGGSGGVSFFILYEVRICRRASFVRRIANVNRLVLPVTFTFANENSFIYPGA